MAATLMDPVAPTEADVVAAKAASRSFPRVIHPGRAARLQEVNGAPGDGPRESVEIPAAVVGLIQRVLAEMANGNAVTIIPIHAELTTQQAADLLGTSRPFVAKLVDSGELPHRKVGTHRRIRFTDLMAYKNRLAADRQKILDQLAADAQEMDRDY